MENSLIPKYLKLAQANQSNFVPYFNLFAGFDSPQPLARGADSGGVLRNTGINFESDGMTAYPTLDASAQQVVRRSGWGWSTCSISTRQIVVEGAVVERMGDSALGSRIRPRRPLSAPDHHAWIVRFDAMQGWRQGQKDIYGVRVEIRRKF